MLTTLLSLCLGAAPAQTERVDFKTASRSFTSTWEFALEDGALYGRPRAEPRPAWQALPLPKGVARAAELSADDRFLVVAGPDGRLYDTDYAGIESGHLAWLDAWGWPFRLMPAPAALPAARRAWAASFLDFEGGYYSEDIDGNPHTIYGVNTVFSLEPDGRGVAFDDPWLPPNPFAHALSSPRRGTVELASLAVSGSVMMGIDAGGVVYTRLIDFDTLGGNPGITYSYQRANFGYSPTGFWAQARGRFPFLLDVRSLPYEAWQPQPRLPGKVTARIAVQQTGQGNAARELRVEGQDASGRTGYFRKLLAGPAWEFVPTGAALAGQPVEAREAPRGPARPGPRDERCSGAATLAVGGAVREVEATLEGFNVRYDPAQLRLETRGGPLLAVLYLQTSTDPVTESGAEIPGALMLLPGAERQASVAARQAMDELFGPGRVHLVRVRVSRSRVRIESHPTTGRLGSRLDVLVERPPAPNYGAQRTP